jgi:hypothetical protein
MVESRKAFLSHGSTINLYYMRGREGVVGETCGALPQPGFSPMPIAECQLPISSAGKETDWQSAIANWQ